MDTQAQALWTKLADAGLVAGDMPARQDSFMPWYLRALVGLSAWIAAIFVMASVGALVYRVFEHASLSILSGAALCAGAALVMNRARVAPFAGQFSVAIAISGQTLLALGLFRAAAPHDAVGWLAIAGMEVVMMLAIADATHRTLAAFFAVAAVYASGWQSHAGTLLPAIAAMGFAATALAADRSARANALLQPASAGIAVAVLLYAPVATILDDVHRAPHALPAQWLQPSLLAVTFVVVVGVLLRRAHADDQRIRVVGMTSTVALASAMALAAATWPVPGLLAAMLVTIVSFAMGRWAMTGLGLLTAVSMLGYYYFSLQTTLLVKALSLMAAGAVLLAAGGLLARRGPPAEGEGHA